MQIQRIMAAAPVVNAVKFGQTTKHESEKKQVVTNPIENNSSRASQIMRNYFMGGQMVNFTGFPCSTSNFKVKELEDMPCTCCGRPMMTNKQTDEFARDAGRASGKELNAILDKNMDYFRAEEKAVVHYIQKQLKDMPDASLTTAITRKGYDAREILKDEQIDVLRRTAVKSEEMLGKENPVKSLCERTLAQSFGVSLEEKVDRRPKNKNNGAFGSNSFNRTGFLGQMVALEQKGVAHKDMHQILDVAVQLPESSSIIDKMISKYSQGSDEAFAKRLIQKAVVTAEHIHPKSKGGPNATDNYMGECQECNGSRGNMSYETWMQKYPNMPDNIQDNIDAVTEEIIKGKIGGNYDDYPVDLKEAVFKETEGKVVLTVKNPEEIDKAREERGLPKPVKDEKERKNAAGAYQGSYHGLPGSERAKSKKPESTEQTTQTQKSGKKKGGKRHIAENAQIVRYMSDATKTDDKKAA